MPSTELKDRARRSLERRTVRAQLGRFEPFSDFDWNWPRAIDRELVEAALRPEFLSAPEPRNIVLVAPQGLGKTMVAQNIAHQAILAGHSVLFTTAAKMLVDLGSVQGTPHLFQQRLRKHYRRREAKARRRVRRSATDRARHRGHSRGAHGAVGDREGLDRRKDRRAPIAMTADRVELSARARADLDDLLEYLLERNPVAALQVSAAIEEAIATLATPSPRVEGRPVTLKSGATCRRWFVHPVVIFYQRAPRVVFIQTEVVEAGLPPRRRSVIGSGEPVTRGALRVGPPVGTVFIRTHNMAAMIKKLSAVGNSLGLIIERPILEPLNITKDTALEIKTDGGALIIRPVQPTKRERVRESTRRMMSVHDETLRKLAK